MAQLPKHNLRMAEKIKAGECIDLSAYPREGDYYVLGTFTEDVDYCNAKDETWIWSIGKRHSDGKILASHRADLYQNPAFQCLWLR